MALTDSRWCRWQGNTANHFKWDHGGEEFISYHWMEGKLQHLPIRQSRCTCTARGARRTWDLPWDPVKIVKSVRIEAVKPFNVDVLLITPKHDRHQKIYWGQTMAWGPWKFSSPSGVGHVPVLIHVQLCWLLCGSYWIGQGHLDFDRCCCCFAVSPELGGVQGVFWECFAG